jgi:sialate O-acetylesterase
MYTHRLLLAALLICFSASADVRLPGFFGDNMVLQRHQPIIIWGWSNPKEKISIQLHRQSMTVTADKNGKWKIMLKPEDAGGPYQLIVKGKNTIAFNNILIGDVWVCSGQSNMEWNVRNSNQADTEIAKADYANIRHIKIPNRISAEPKDDITPTSWEICNPETVGDFTAVGFYFARELTEQLNIPIGLINTSWGGTHVETWTSRDAFENSEEFRTMIASMPKVNLDSVAKKNSEKVFKRIEGLQGKLTTKKELIDQWKKANFDDTSWPVMNVPSLWEEQELGDFDGVVWLRKTFSVPVSAVGKEAVLHLGKVDDADETYVNGSAIGNLSNYSEARQYTIPAGILKGGENVIAVRVTDTGGGGGIYGDPSMLKISFAGETESIAGQWRYQVEALSENISGVGPNSYPTLLFNAMVHPLIPFAIKGALWYQGESNAGRAYQYRKAFPLMINDWRQKWGQGDFPFYFVQLASFNAGDGNSQTGSTWAELREAQAMTLSLPNTGMAVTTDIGDPDDIHPRNKLDVGKRLAALALRDAYGTNVQSSGPTFESLRQSGNKMVVTFTNTGSGLIVKDKYGYVRGFEIAGPDRKFRHAKAEIAGNTVTVYHEAVREPTAVRFGWADDASDNNLFNAEGFPAVPFRSDNWNTITEKLKFTIND